LPADGTVEPVAPDTAAGDAWWPRGGGAWARFAIPPLAAFVLAQVVLYVAAIRDHTTSGFFTPVNWARWDSGNYLSIPAHDYSARDVRRCAVPPAQRVRYRELVAALPLAHRRPRPHRPRAAVRRLVLSWLFAYLTLQGRWALIQPEWSYCNWKTPNFATPEKICSPVLGPC
jgi:hypothetical protein